MADEVGEVKAELTCASGNCANIELKLEDDDMTLITEIRFARRPSIEDRKEALQSVAQVAFSFYATVDGIKAAR